ncbi:hypothetical protein EDD18DRAFT_58278 [Armillaria luteobubalina]|uniref:NACHT domain-containing protein n=1 Tax=Armillaria luteobubalina TaxID=153913 RepID=A0AA39TRZ6_9AGAR|nr:hypothetical protein EDD18DRAFT_58278 [Armillaria luteobubalina]
MGIRTLYHQHFPTPDGSKPAHAQLRREVFAGLKVTFKTIQTVFDGCPVPGVKAFLGICSDTMSMLEAGMVNRHDSEELDPLVHDIHERFSGLLQRYREVPEHLRGRIAIVVHRTEEFHPHLQKILEKGTVRRAFTAPNDRALIARYLEHMKDALNMIMTEAALHAAIDASFLVNNSLFSALECVRDASWDMAPECHECTEGTRVDILHKLSSWLDDLSLPQIFWINGMAGTGKTTLAKSVARIATDRKVLGGSFFCSRRSADRRDFRRIIPSIAFHLAAVNEEYCRQVLKVIRECKLGLVKTPPSEHWQKLIVEPLRDSGAGSSLPVLIIMDGLDECDNLDKELWSPLWNQFLKSLSDLPRVKVLLTSRPNDFTCVNSPPRSVSVLDLHDSHCESDIRLFVRRRLSSLGRSHPTQWPSDEHIAWIAKESDRLFIYAAEICRHVVSPGSPEQQLKKLLDNGTGLSVGMVRFYGHILTSALRFLNDEKVEECQAILGALILQKIPRLSLNDLSILFEHDVSHVRGLLAGFHSVLLVPVGDDEPIYVFHPSFITFITSHNPWKGVCDVDGCERSRCSDRPLLRFPQFYLESKRYHLKITMALLKFMIPNLSSQGDDRHITLRTRFPCRRPGAQALEYACTHWPDHLQLSSSDEQQEVRALADILARFLKERGKNWLDDTSSYDLLFQSKHVIEKADTWRLSHSSMLSPSTDLYIKQQLNILRFSIIISSGLPGVVHDEDYPPPVQLPAIQPDTAPKEDSCIELGEWPCWLRPPSPPRVQMPEPDFLAVVGPWQSTTWEESMPEISRMPARFPSWGHRR